MEQRLNNFAATIQRNVKHVVWVNEFKENW